MLASVSDALGFCRDQVPARRRSMATSRRSGIGWRSQSTRQCKSGALRAIWSTLRQDVQRMAEPPIHLLCRYMQTSQNDLAYWGLDYPPMSAYQVD